MDVSWSDRKLRRDASSDKAGTKAWGKDEWKIFKRRIASLEAAPTLSDLRGVPGRFHQLTGNRKGQFAIALWGQMRLVFEPSDEPIPTLYDGGIDETKVTAVRIREVVDYHD